MKPLLRMRVVSLAVNVPGPVAASRLQELGAEVIKIEPPGGDPLARACPAWYADLSRGQRVTVLDLKAPGGRAGLDGFLAQADLLLTSSRSGALSRLGLGREDLASRHPGLSHVAIVGHPAPGDDVPGHDLTYQAGLGLLSPPDLPRTLLADLAGAERAVSAALALLLGRERGGRAGYAEVSLSEAASGFAEPLRYGLTVPGALLGGGAPEYNLYRASDAWISVAALEPHFRQKLLEELGLVEGAGYEDLARVFRTRSAQHWEAWAAPRDLPLTSLRETPLTCPTGGQE